MQDEGETSVIHSVLHAVLAHTYCRFSGKRIIHITEMLRSDHCSELYWNHPYSASFNYTIIQSSTLAVMLLEGYILAPL